VGVVRGLAVFALILAISLFGLTASMFYREIQPREEFAEGDSVTGMLPLDRIRTNQIQVYGDRVIINARELQWASFTATGSMLPVLGPGANALQEIPKSADEIQIGDIVSYKIGSKVIIHRIIETGSDESGWYAITKGDNNAEPDPAPVRFSQIDRVVVGILY
jgi:hypothetical protein